MSLITLYHRRINRFTSCLIVTLFILASHNGSSQDLDFFYSFLCPKDGSTISHMASDQYGNIVIGGQYHGSMDFDPGPGVRWSTSSVSTVSDHFTIHLDSDGLYRYHQVSDYRGFDNLVYLKYGKDNRLYKIVNYIYEKHYTLYRSNSWDKIVRSENLNTDKFSCTFLEFGDDYFLVRGYTPASTMIIGQDTIALPSYADVFIAKYDYDGNLLTNSILFAPSSLSIHDAEINGNGDIYFGGSYTNDTRISFNGRDTTLVSSGDKDALYGKIDGEGNLIWLTTLPQSQQFDEDVVSIGLDSSEHLYLITRPNALISNRMYKVDSDGEVIWEKKVGNRPDNHKLFVLKNGDFYLKSRYYISGDMDPNPVGQYPVTTIYSQQYGNYLAKFTKEGEIIWGKRLYAAIAGSAKVEIDNKENIYIGGSMDDWIVIDEDEMTTKTYKSPHPRLSAGYLFKWSPQTCNADEKTDYYIKKTDADIGIIDSLVDNTIPWLSHGISKNNDPFDSELSYDSIKHSANNYSIRIHNRGCADSLSSQLEVYYSLPTSQLKWPNDWQLAFQSIAGDSIKTSDQIESIKIPNLLRNQSWTTTFNFRNIPSPSSFDQDLLNVNILARINSISDPMEHPETEDILTNVLNNNNIGWKVFTIK